MPSSTSISRSASRVIRKGNEATVSSPGKSILRWAAMISSMIDQDGRTVSLVRVPAVRLGNTDRRENRLVGTLTLAKNSLLLPVAHDDREVEGEIGDEGERVGIVECERGQHGKTSSTKKGALLLSGES